MCPTPWTRKVCCLQRILHYITSKLESQLQALNQTKVALRFVQSWLLPRSTPPRIYDKLTTVEDYLIQQSRQISELLRITVELLTTVYVLLHQGPLILPWTSPSGQESPPESPQESP